jgi:hypothetical protein
LKLSGTVLILLLSQLSSFGQIDVGLKGSINTSTTIYLNHPVPYKWGYDAGVVVDWTLHKRLFLSTQIQYSQKGNRTGNGILTLSYLSVPILFGYRVSKRLSLLLGIEDGILLHASEASSGSTKNFTYQYKPLDFGVNGGMRWLLFKNAGFYFSYVLSLDVIERPSVTFPFYNDATNNVDGTITTMTYHADNLRNPAFQFGFYYFFR